MKAFIEYIQTISPLSTGAQDSLKNICSMLSVRKKAIVQPIGHTCKTIYFIKKGALRIFYLNGKKEVTESLEFENAFVARMESLITGQPSRKGIQAIENSELIAINATGLFELMDSCREIDMLSRKVFFKILITTLNRIESLQFHNAEERYLQLLKEQPAILKRAPLKYIASYLGITQVSLSRIRARF